MKRWVEISVFAEPTTGVKLIRFKEVDGELGTLCIWDFPLEWAEKQTMVCNLSNWNSR